MDHVAAGAYSQDYTNRPTTTLVGFANRNRRQLVAFGVGIGLGVEAVAVTFWLLNSKKTSEEELPNRLLLQKRAEEQRGRMDAARFPSWHRTVLGRSSFSFLAECDV